MPEVSPESLAALLARGPLSNLTQEQLEIRRVSLLEAKANLEAGITIAPAFVPVPRKARASRARTAYRFATEEERAEAHRLANARSAAKVKAEVASGLRLRRITPYIPVPVNLTLPIGKWITYRTHSGREQTVQILAAILPGAVPQVPPGASRKHLAGDAKPSNTARYLLALPSHDALAAFAVLLTRAAELEPNLVAIHDAPPEDLIGRLVEPIRRGTWVEWTSTGAGFTGQKSGEILAYVPAGASAEKCAHFTRPPGDTNKDLSNRDRYIVRSGQKIYTPVAYVLDRMILDQRKIGVAV